MAATGRLDLEKAFNLRKGGEKNLGMRGRKGRAEKGLTCCFTITRKRRGRSTTSRGTPLLGLMATKEKREKNCEQCWLGVGKSNGATV